MADYAAEGVIVHLERLNNSTMGNPAWRVHLDDGSVYRTQSNASVSYEIDNQEYRGKRVRLLLTEARRVWDISVL